MSQHDSSQAGQPDTPEHPAGAADGAPAGAPADTAGLAEALRKAEAQAQEHQENWLRARAEADNIRKRAQMDVASAHKYAIDNFAGELLPVYDALDAALATGNATAESLRDGVELTRKQLRTAFEKFGLIVLDPAGEKFDPHHHQAMTAIESDAPPQSVLQVFQKGFKLHDRVIRPALVAVSKAKAGDGEVGTAPA
ncbi:MAG: nucleotide exchange factor GrpE [bacterium]|jgi:molecular chaperone GrpE|nr:nucleotide exchange factor GrpE [Betaproteobacteria bacterium]